MSDSKKKDNDSGNKYSEKAQEKISKVMKEYKEGELKTSAGDKVKSRDQAIAIGISEARQEGYKTPPPPDEKEENES